MERVRRLVAASLIVVLLHLPPVAEAARSVHDALRRLAPASVIQRVLPVAVPEGVRPGPVTLLPRRSADGLPDALALRWPDGDVFDVAQRFEALAESFGYPFTAESAESAEAT